jgi:hypothetical protein
MARHAVDVVIANHFMVHLLLLNGRWPRAVAFRASFGAIHRNAVSGCSARIEPNAGGLIL